MPAGTFTIQVWSGDGALDPDAPKLAAREVDLTEPRTTALRIEVPR